MKTLNQEMLAWAYAKTAPMVGGDASLIKKYRTAVRGAPAFVQGSGLAQAKAFWNQKAAKEDGYRHMLSFLDEAPGLRDWQRKVLEADVAEYMFLTSRVQLALLFLKRMADALLVLEEDDA